MNAIRCPPAWISARAASDPGPFPAGVHEDWSVPALITRTARPTKYIWGFPSRVVVTGATSLFVACASWYLIAGTSAIHCDSLAPLTVIATMAAFLISVCFRQMGRFADRRSRWFLFACLLVAGATLFVDFRFVRQYRGFCEQLRQQIRQSTPTR